MIQERSSGARVGRSSGLCDAQSAFDLNTPNVDTITRMGREMDVSLFVQNGPSQASLGAGGEGYLSYSIATPTGEGITTPLTFTRYRRVMMTNTLRMI